MGRIVIPKELREKLKILDNENVRISIFDKYISIEKYSYLKNNEKIIEEVCNAAKELFGLEFEVYDLDNMLFTNHKSSTFAVKKEAELINNSVSIGKMVAFSNSNEDSFNNNLKFICRILVTCMVYS